MTTMGAPAAVAPSPPVEGLLADVERAGPFEGKYQLTDGDDMVSTATVKLWRGNHIREDAATSENKCRKESEVEVEGPINALFTAVDRCFGYTPEDSPELVYYHVESTGRGKQAQASVTLELQYANKAYRGENVNANTFRASFRAYLAAMNQIGCREE